MPQQRILACDLDGTLLNTSRLFYDIDRYVAEKLSRSVLEVVTARKRLSKIGFTFTGWFKALGCSDEHGIDLETLVRLEYGGRVRSHLYPGIQDLLERRPRRFVLVTAGDPQYQRWKFEQLGLEHLFREEDCHFIPMNGSKAEILARYTHRGPLAFLENLPHWHQEVYEEGLLVRQIRVVWPGDSAHAGDHLRWQVARTVVDIERLLDAG